MCCGRRSRGTAARSPSSAISASGRSTPRPASRIEVAIALRGAPAATSVEHRTFSDQLQELSLSPDGRKAAFTVHGEVFSISARDGGDAVRVTETAARGKRDLPGRRTAGAWPTCRIATARIICSSTTSGPGKETQLTTGAGRDDVPRFSPDGKWIAFERDSKELRVIDPATKEEKLLATGSVRHAAVRSMRATSPGRPTRATWPT